MLSNDDVKNDIRERMSIMQKKKFDEIQLKRITKLNKYRSKYPPLSP